MITQANIIQRKWNARRDTDSMTYKSLKEPQPSLPPGTGIVSIDHRDIGLGIHWSPVFLVEENDFVNFEYFSDPRHGGPLSYGGRHARRKAIGYLWRRYRRDDLEYSRGWHSLLGKQCHLDYCSAGVAGNLYQYQTVTITEAAERLHLPVVFIRKLCKAEKIKARLITGKSGRRLFHNYYQFTLAYLEAYLDRHGYGKDYPSYAERQRELGTTRKLPAIIWCV